jgi:hypothetical protein
VIIPLEFHRGQALRCIRGWAKEQLFPREQFEILVASPAGHPLAELDEICAVLGPQDRVLEFDREHDMDLCAKAAEHAHAEVLFFTESHCIPEPETLARADAVVREHPEWAGFSCCSVPITSNLLSEIEAEWYGRDIEFGMNEHPWRKVLDQCFVVRRSDYFQAGGFDPAYGHFAEWLIAARFYDLGMKIGYAPTVRVHHVYIGEFGEWHRFTADFVQGQMAYLALEPGDRLTTMFDEVPEWSRRHAFRRTVALRVCRMLLHDLRVERAERSGGLWSASRWHWRPLRSWVVRAVAGHAVVLMTAQRRRLTSRLALRVDLLRRDTQRAEVRLGRCCEAIATVERMKFLRRQVRRPEQLGADPSALDGALPHDTGLWQPGRLDEDHGVGFYEAEVSGAEAFRWSEPAAYVELPLAAGQHRIRLNWLFRPLVSGEPSLRFYIDERPLRSADVSVRDDHAEFRVDVLDASSALRLGWVCAEYRAEGDHRALGLPVVSVAWSRDELESNHLHRRTADVLEPVAPDGRLT